MIPMENRRALKLMSWVSLREMATRNLVYALIPLVLVVVFSTVGFQLYELGQQSATMDPVALRDQVGEVLAQGLGAWFSMTSLFALIYAAFVFKNDLEPRILHNIITRPIARWEYLVGKLLGMLTFFFAFLGIGVLIAVGISLYWSTPLDGGVFVTGLAVAMAQVTVYAALSMTLSMGVSPVGGISLALILRFLSGVAEQWMDVSTAWIRWLAYGAYYVTPAQIRTNLMDHALRGTALTPDWALYWGVIAENVFYAGLALLFATIALRRMDLS